MWFLPPDPNSKMEFWLLVALSNMALTIRSPWGLVGIAFVVYVLICVAIATLVLRALTREAAILRRRMFGRSREARVLQVAVVLLVVCWSVAGWLWSHAGHPAYVRYLFAWSLLLFMATVEIVEARIRRGEPDEAFGELPADIALSDIVAWQETVTHAQATTKP